MTLAPRTRMTIQEYLAFDLAHEGKHEYVNGEVWSMAGGALAHNLVTMNVGIALGLRLRGTPCRVYSSDQRVRIDETGLYCYPDLTIVCGAPETVPTSPPTLTNPKVLIEVLSGSTAAFDKDVKFAHYRRRTSVAAVLFVSPPDRRVERYARAADGWVLTEARDEGVLLLPELGVELPLVEVFAGLDEALLADAGAEQA